MPNPYMFPPSAFLQLLEQVEPPWASVRSQPFPVTVVSVNSAFIWCPWCVQHGLGTTLKNYQTQSAVLGLRTLLGSQHHPPDTRLGSAGLAVHRDGSPGSAWTKVLGESHGAARPMLRPHAQQRLLKSRTEEKATQGAKQTEPRPQNGGECAGHRGTLPSPTPLSEW